MVQKTLGASQIWQKRDYDLHAQPSRYEVGDVVLLANSARKVGVCPKLAPLWKGPYVVVGVPSTVLCRLASARKEWVVHQDRLRPCREDPLPLWVRRKRCQLLHLPPPDPEATSHGGGNFEDLFPDSQLDDPAEPIYCICRRPDDGQMMIACDACYEWFHVKCMDLSLAEAEQLDYYICPSCCRLGGHC